MMNITFREAHAAADRALKDNWSKVAGVESNRQSSILLEASIKSFSEHNHYDFFLSHSIRDDKAVLGVKQLLEDSGYSVYIDWIDDKQLDRSKVNKETAKTLRKRMKQCDSLCYLLSKNCIDSKWTPWELGYMDGCEKKIYIIPIAENSNADFSGVEYLSLYPCLDYANGKLKK